MNRKTIVSKSNSPKHYGLTQTIVHLSSSSVSKTKKKIEKSTNSTDCGWTGDLKFFGIVLKVFLTIVKPTTLQIHY